MEVAVAGPQEVEVAMEAVAMEAVATEAVAMEEVKQNIRNFMDEN
jgi:hypothetical protein